MVLMDEKSALVCYGLVPWDDWPLTVSMMSQVHDNPCNASSEHKEWKHSILYLASLECQLKAILLSQNNRLSITLLTQAHRRAGLALRRAQGLLALLSGQSGVRQFVSNILDPRQPETR